MAQVSPKVEDTDSDDGLKVTKLRLKTFKDSLIRVPLDDTFNNKTVQTLKTQETKGTGSLPYRGPKKTLVSRIKTTIYRNQVSKDLNSADSLYKSPLQAFDGDSKKRIIKRRNSSTMTMQNSGEVHTALLSLHPSLPNGSKRLAIVKKASHQITSQTPG